jgi:hypothetical protein
MPAHPTSAQAVELLAQTLSRNSNLSKGDDGRAASRAALERDPRGRRGWYSRLMGADEEGTLTRLNAHRREFLAFRPDRSLQRGRSQKFHQG